jgi:hypothetical protein
MAIFAVVNENIVTNIIVADSLEIAEMVSNTTCVEFEDYSTVSIGYLYDGNKFVAPVADAE